MDAALLGRTLAALAIIALVLGGLQLALRLVGRPFSRRARLVQILETQFLPGGASLHVARVLGRYYLIGRGSQIASLGELPPAEVSTSLRGARVSRTRSPGK